MGRSQLGERRRDVHLVARAVSGLLELAKISAAAGRTGASDLN